MLEEHTYTKMTIFNESSLCKHWVTVQMEVNILCCVYYTELDHHWNTVGLADASVTRWSIQDVCVVLDLTIPAVRDHLHFTGLSEGWRENKCVSVK